VPLNGGVVLLASCGMPARGVGLVISCAELRRVFRRSGAECGGAGELGNAPVCSSTP
jgi:hypothetical protein